MRGSILAVKGALVLLAIAPAAAAAQSQDDAYVAAMNLATAKRAVNPVKPGDKDLGCTQIRAELATLDSSITAQVGHLDGVVATNAAAQKADRNARQALNTVRNVANKVLPVGDLITKPMEAALDAKRAAQQGRNVSEATALSGDFQYIAARMGHLHGLAAERCGPQAENAEGKTGE